MRLMTPPRAAVSHAPHCWPRPGTAHSPMPLATPPVSSPPAGHASRLRATPPVPATPSLSSPAGHASKLRATPRCRPRPHRAPPLVTPPGYWPRPGHASKLRATPRCRPRPPPEPGSHPTVQGRTSSMARKAAAMSTLSTTMRFRLRGSVRRTVLLKPLRMLWLSVPGEEGGSGSSVSRGGAHCPRSQPGAAGDSACKAGVLPLQPTSHLHPEILHCLGSDCLPGWG